MKLRSQRDGAKERNSILHKYLMQTKVICVPVQNIIIYVCECVFACLYVMDSVLQEVTHSCGYSMREALMQTLGNSSHMRLGLNFNP